jgi:hypothetical protein
MLHIKNIYCQKKVTGVPEGRSYTNAKLGRELIFINFSNQAINFKLLKKENLE